MERENERESTGDKSIDILLPPRLMWLFQTVNPRSFSCPGEGGPGDVSVKTLGSFLA